MSKRADRALEALDRGLDDDLKAKELLLLVQEELQQIEEELEHG